MRIAMLLLAATALAAQDKSAQLFQKMLETESGAIVRVQLDDGKKRTGRFVSLGTDTLRLQTATSSGFHEEEIPVTRIRQYRIKDKHNSIGREMQRAAVGTLSVIGVVIGFALFLRTVG